MQKIIDEFSWDDSFRKNIGMTHGNFDLDKKCDMVVTITRNGKVFLNEEK